MEKLSLKKRYSRLNVARKIRQQVAIPAWRVLLISSGWRVIIAAMPPPNAYTAHTNAKMSAKVPNTSIATPLPPGTPGALHATSLGGLGRGDTFTTRRCFILGSAFRLNNLGDKSSICSGVALHEGLGLVYKCVWQRVGADVTDRHRLPFPLQHKINAAGEVANTSAGDGPADAHALTLRAPRQRRKFGDGVVVSLALSIAKPS